MSVHTSLESDSDSSPQPSDVDEFRDTMNSLHDLALPVFKKQRSIIEPTSKYSKYITPAAVEPTALSQSISLSKSGVSVFVRFRPDNDVEKVEGSDCIVIEPDHRTVTLDADSSYSFRFKYVFPRETAQEDIFECCALPMVENVIDGYNGTVLVYGQTGAGKTYSIFGPGYDNAMHIDKSPPALRGIVPRMVQAMFHSMYSQMVETNSTFEMEASYIQIYLEKMSDLLNPAKTSLKIYQDAKHGLWITDATKAPVKNLKEVLKILQLGAERRVTAATKSNEESSRSHALLVLTVKKHLEKAGEYRASQVYLVDLCGSERISKTGAQDIRLVEAQNINKSLLALGNVIAALTEKRRHIPYRDSKLTRLLQNCFGGNSYTSLLLCCSSNTYNWHETLSTLRFGDRAMRIQNRPQRNQIQSPEELRRLLGIANDTIMSQRRHISSLSERNLVLENIILELYSQLNPDQIRAVKSKYAIDMVQKPKSPFNRLGLNPFVYIFYFVHAYEIFRFFRVSKLWCQRLRYEHLWYYHYLHLSRGQVSLTGSTDRACIMAEFEELDEKEIFSYYEAVKNALHKKQKIIKGEDVEGSGSSMIPSTGLHLFPNIA